MSTNKEEDKYFEQVNKERRESLRRERELTALRQTEREGIAAKLQTNEEIASEALDLGFSAETARVLMLVPLIQVAWVDGSVSNSEEQSVLEKSAAAGILPNSPAHDFLRRLLANQPSPLFFERTNRVIAHMIQADPASFSAMDLTRMCESVAEASGGFFGFGDRVSDEERELIASLASQFGASQASTHGLKVYGEERK